VFVCVCKGIKESDVRALGQAGVTCPKVLACSLGLNDEDNCCGRCLNNIDDFVNMATDELIQCRSSVQA